MSWPTDGNGTDLLKRCGAPKIDRKLHGEERNRKRDLRLHLKPRAKGRNIVGQQLPTLLNVTCCVRLHTLLHVVTCCLELLRKV